VIICPAPQPQLENNASARNGVWATAASAAFGTGLPHSVPRHVNDYKHCIITELERVRQSQRCRENTHQKLFGSQKSAERRQQLETACRGRHNTHEALFGEQTQGTSRRVCQSKSSDRKDTHNSLFGPPPVWKHRRSAMARIREDVVDLLCHDGSVRSRNAMNCRYPLRNENTTSKLFGTGSETVASPSPSSTEFSALCRHTSRMSQVQTVKRSSTPPAEPIAH
jgi:hypothetical protein